MENRMVIEDIIESLRQWDVMFYSESETKYLMKEAADYLERLINEK